jgi:CspA family cold shock protein
MQLALDTGATNGQTSIAFADAADLVWPREWTYLLLLRRATMSEGTIKRLTDKGFGFIENGSGTDMFFHMSAVEGVRYEELREGQKVSYNEGRGPKGPRAENVRVL